VIRVGCSGFYYPNWKNKFYPRGVPQKEWLSYYSSVFQTVELNGTFYKLPKPSDLKRYFQITPNDFTFSVKVSRFITHVKRLTIRQSIDDFQNRVRENLENKLQYFLFQFPSNFRNSEENLDRVLSNVPNSPQSVVEFRHRSWWNAHVKESLTRSNITFANVDYPGLDTYVINTSPAFYLRLHGNPVLFSSNYDASTLEKFQEQIPHDAVDANVYFNNTKEEAGFKNAAQFVTMVKKHQTE
jgi:uncharacterized protein YecE (DUF72 family)